MKILIDAMGGVTVYSDYAFTAITRTDIKEGENHLTGQQALDFARERVTLPGGDNDRGKNQMKVITAVIEKASFEYIPLEYDLTGRSMKSPSSENSTISSNFLLNFSKNKSIIFFMHSDTQ